MIKITWRFPNPPNNFFFQFSNIPTPKKKRGLINHKKSQNKSWSKSKTEFSKLDLQIGFFNYKFAAYSRACARSVTKSTLRCGHLFVRRCIYMCTFVVYLFFYLCYFFIVIIIDRRTVFLYLISETRASDIDVLAGRTSIAAVTSMRLYSHGIYSWAPSTDVAR